jgi:hypothetical protein
MVSAVLAVWIILLIIFLSLSWVAAGRELKDRLWARREEDRLLSPLAGHLAVARGSQPA